MDTPTFLHLGSGQISDLVQCSSKRVIYCAPGVQQAVAASLINTRKRLGREAVRVILDIDDSTTRLGYGEFDAFSLLLEEGVEIRVERSLRTCVLICDDLGYAFFTPPMLVEDLEENHIGVNAMQLHPLQVELIVQAISPKPVNSTSPLPSPEVGKAEVTEKQIEQVKEALAANPPQKFDLARKVNVFNAYIEFAELRLTGLHISKHTVQLPRNLVLALKDDTTAKRLLTTFRLVGEDSKVAKEATEIDQKVRQLRETLTRSLGEGLGTVILRSKRKQFSEAVEHIRSDIAKFQEKVTERLEKEIELSKRKLIEGLLPAIKKNPPEALTSQMSGKPTVEILRRYIDVELSKVFPEAKSLIGEMRLDWTPKGVTYETLSNPDFQQKVRAAFPYENFDKPFSEFEAAPAAQNTQKALFD